MFEVGKKYQSLTYGTIRTCLMVEDGVAFLSKAQNHKPSSPFSVPDFNGWKEYKEPVVEKIKKTVVEGNYSPYVVCDDVVSRRIVGDLELTITDGKLTDARVL